MKNAPALSRRARQRQLGCMRLRLPWAALLLTAATALALLLLAQAFPPKA